MSFSQLADRLQTEPAPLVDGNLVTFVWKGKTAPQLMGDFTDWERDSPLSMECISEGLWIYQVELLEDAYIEYTYVKGDERLLDPLNPRRSPDGVGHINQFFYMPKASSTPLAKYNRSISHGIVTTHQVATYEIVVGKTRTVHLYQPPTADPSPLVVVWDGKEYLRRGRLVQIMDNLIHQGRMRPVALAMVHHGGKARMSEYACSEATLLFLLYRVLPLAQAHLNLVDLNESPRSYGVLGASMGGLMASYTALRLPHMFGHVLCQSGGFSLGEVSSIVFDMVDKDWPPPLKIWMDIGLYDFRFLLDSNRQMHKLMVSKNYPVAYREYPGGHNYPSWRDEVWRGLEYLFPPST